MQSRMEEARSRIIPALDVPTLEEVERLVTALGSYHPIFKVGLELINSVGGPKVVSVIHDLSGRVFYDIKLKDIPNTIAGASKAIARMGVNMFNVHASAGVEGLIAARMAAQPNWLEVNFSNQSAQVRHLILAVTVLTSLDEENCHLIYGAPSKAKVLQFARDALLAGLNGVVCSPQELTLLGKQMELSGLVKVTPGVRPTWASTGDQKRVMTPAEAIKAGATYLVIGRPITQPPSEIGTPAQAFERIAEEIAEVL